MAHPSYPPYPPPSDSPQPYIHYPPQQSYLPNPPIPYQHLPVQYVYVPVSSEDASLPASPSKSLPVITTIHSLNSKTDFYAWDEGVCTLLQLLGIYGHPAFPINPLCPEQSPTVPPSLSQPPTPAEMKSLTRWKDNDNVAQYVIVGRLGGLARQLLPSAYMGTRTAYTMYSTITCYFGLRNFGDCDELATSLLQLCCDHNRLQDYVARWRAGVTRLCSAKYPFSVRVFINAFVKCRKPDLLHLCVWGCECYVAVPNEVRGKAGPKRFRAIFVGYEEHRVGWRVRSLEGRYSFSNDVIFDENLSGHLGVPHQISPDSPATSLPVSP